ncbi:MAG: 4Fe-4S binding protein [Prevotella sp.]|nr:4Fe-4S binding protein [Prevotella sp.]
MLRKIRIALATVMFVGLVLLFLDFTGTLHTWLGWMAKVQFLPAVMALNVGVIVGLVLLTLVFGRIYCSVVCPLGIMQDVFGWFGKRARKNRYSYSKAVSWLRYAVLVLFVVAFVLGIGSIVQLLAPYSAFGRIMTALLQPLWMLGNNVLASVAERIDSYTFYSVDVWMKSLPVFIVALVTLIVLFVLAWRGGRTYCNTICPVGTVLSFFARFSLFKVRFIEEKCRACSLCTKNCKASCIDYKNHKVDYSRCVVCGDCISKCKFGALNYSLPTKPTKPTQPTQPTQPTESSSRRSFLLASAMLTTAALAQEKKKVDGGLAILEKKQAPHRTTPLTPPGSLSAANLAKRCTGCQLCVSECPNDVLRPHIPSSIFNLQSSFMQPEMSYERGYCRPECTRCSDVCPAGAIKPIDGIEKSSIQIGHAQWYHWYCLPVTDGVECGNCARHCPTGAIEMVPLHPTDDLSPMVPSVNESLCIGCGACEHLCPVRPVSAIQVEGHEVHKMI